MERFGKIQKLNRSGIGFIADTGVAAAPTDFVFSFDKIRRRVGVETIPYRGESIETLGFKEGARVKFREDNGLVESVELT